MSGYLARIDTALDVAHEHTEWCRRPEINISPAAVLAALGERCLPRAGWDDAIAALAMHWRELPIRHTGKFSIKVSLGG